MVTLPANLALFKRREETHFCLPDHPCTFPPSCLLSFLPLCGVCRSPEKERSELTFFYTEGQEGNI